MAGHFTFVGNLVKPWSASIKAKVHSDLRHYVQLLTLVDDQWMEFARVW